MAFLFTKRPLLLHKRKPKHEEFHNTHVRDVNTFGPEHVNYKVSSTQELAAKSHYSHMRLCHMDVHTGTCCHVDSGVTLPYAACNFITCGFVASAFGRHATKSHAALSHSATL